MKAFLGVAAFAALAFLAAGLPAADGSGPAGLKPLVLGQSAALRGPAALLSLERWHGAQLCFEALNAEGGVKGLTLGVAAFDDGGDPEITLANTMELGDMETVFALFGYEGAAGLGQSFPVIERHPKDGLFLFGEFSGARAPRERPHVRRVFTVRPSYRDEARALLAKLHGGLGLSRIAWAAQGDAEGKAAAEAWKAALEAQGLTPTAALAGGDPPGDDAIQALLDLGAQAVVLAEDAASCAAFVKGARKAGFKGVIAGFSLADPDLLLAGLEGKEKGAPEAAGPLLLASAVPDWGAKDIPLVLEYRAAVDKPAKGAARAPYDQEPLLDRAAPYSFAALEGFLNAKLFAAILKTVQGKPSRQNFVAAAEAASDVDVGLKERASFGPERHQALDTVYLVGLKDGAWAPAD